MKGYNRRVLEESLSYMRERGYHISALYGIPHYYTKLGYTGALVDAECKVATRDAETAVARYAVRDMVPEDAPRVVEIYEGMYPARTGRIVRDPKTWKSFRWGVNWTDRVGAYVLTDGERIVGYTAYNLDFFRFAIGEVGYVDGSVFSTLLAEAAKRAVAMRIEHVVFHTAPDDPFVAYCQRYGCEVRVTYARWGGFLARIIDQDRTLALVQPVLARRLQQAMPLGWRGSLVFDTELATTRLVLGSADPELCVQLSQGTLVQLLLGYRAPADLTFESDARFATNALPVLQALFPVGYPYMWVADRF